ncbi:MAG TPA: glycosyltransferase family 2 protein [Bryobacteraceae bacterium]|nr:glycosyltransferase family 2 protein [Bryobacteraceae bacterium]
MSTIAGTITDRSQPQDVRVKQACVLMITMNEETAVAGQIEEIRKQAGTEMPIVIVDSSSDRTPEIAAAMGATVIRQFPPRGYGRAMLAGQLEAAKMAEVIVTMDCDMTYPAERIPEFIALIEQGYDCVSGSRMNESNGSMPLINRLGNRAFALLVRLLFRNPTTDLTTGMRAFRSSVITAIEWVPMRFFPAEQGLRIHQAGFHVVELPIEYRVRIGEVKMQRVRDTIALLKAIYHCWRTPVRTKTGHE